jgi:hypothetical protein
VSEHLLSLAAQLPTACIIAVMEDPAHTIKLTSQHILAPLLCTIAEHILDKPVQFTGMVTCNAVELHLRCACCTTNAGASSNVAHADATISVAPVQAEVTPNPTACIGIKVKF